MSEPGFWSAPRISGGLLVAAIVPLALGVSVFLGRAGIQGGSPRSPGLFILERGSILSAVVLTAFGFVLLESWLQASAGSVLGRIGAMAYFFGAILLVAAEAMSLAERGTSYYPLIVVYVVLAFLGQAAVGGALLQSGLLPAWIGWMAVAWNLAWLVVLPLATPQDIYFPVVHHAMPLLIGGALLWRG